jgi:hypothetical protein
LLLEAVYSVRVGRMPIRMRMRVGRQTGGREGEGEAQSFRRVQARARNSVAFVLHATGQRVASFAHDASSRRPCVRR